MWTTKFWRDALERCIRTIAQTVLAAMGTTVVGITSLDWAQIAAVAATAGVASLLTSIVGSGRGDIESASLLKDK